MASLFERKGVWYINYRHKGRQYRRSTKTSDRKLAEFKLKELELELFRGKHSPHAASETKPTLANFFSRYAEFSNSTKSRATNLSDQYRIRQIREYFARRGLTRIEQITLGELQLFQSFILTTHNARTYNNFFGLLRAMLNKAVEWGLIASNPIKGSKPLKVPKKVRYFSIEEIDKLRSAADLEMKLMVDIAIYAGLRRSELYYLRWKDIDMGHRVIYITAHGEFVPKNKKSGAVPIYSKLWAILIEIYPTAKDFDLDQYVLSREHHGHPLNPTQILSRRFGRLAKKAGVKNACLHDCRHTFASHLIQQGVRLAEVKELMRHSDIQSTMIYAHLSPDSHNEAIEKLDY